ncbi:hypothetical protein FGIG_10823 [Fasciola gigantica]|uniref:Uncharacterized protein n=1 Tax=Fasciola gigantica TaxID=46835 RepID=A0A504YDU6_FASGI|nr:hypothetical protein FGIG_10823 [Fasciola gigantica]
MGKLPVGLVSTVQYRVDYGDAQFAIVAVEVPGQVVEQSASFTACCFERAEQYRSQKIMLVSFCKPMVDRTDHTMAVLELADCIQLLFSGS